MTIEGLKRTLIAEPLRQLKEALASPLLASENDWQANPEQARQLALLAARGRGYAVLTGLAGDPTVPRLPPHVVRLAVPAAIAFFQKLSEMAADLGHRWDEEEDFDVRDKICLDALQNRLDALAIYCGLFYPMSVEASGEALGELATQVRDAEAQYDATLRAEEELLASVADYPLLKNWRAVIAFPPVSERLWFLELEAVAARVACEVEEDLQSFRNELWEAICARVGSNRGPRILTFPPKLLTHRVAAAATRVQLWLQWNSPDGRYQANSLLEYPAYDDEALKLVFYRSDGSGEATEIRGHLVRLAGVLQRVDDRCEAAFRVGDLRRSLEQGAEFRLEVGPDESSLETWPADPRCLEDVQRQLESEE